MALLPNTIIYGATGNDSTPTEKINGGVVIGTTSKTDVNNGPITKVFNLTDNAIDGEPRRSLVLPASGTAHAYSAQKAYAAGTFARDQVATEWIMRGVTTKINGVANNVLLINGTPENRVKTMNSNKSKGAQTSSAHRSGYWRPLGIAGQRTNWSTAPATNNVSYVLPTNNASNAVDQGQFVTYRSVPGELVYMEGALDATLKDYPAR